MANQSKIYSTPDRHCERSVAIFPLDGQPILNLLNPRPSSRAKRGNLIPQPIRLLHFVLSLNHNLQSSSRAKRGNLPPGWPTNPKSTQPQTVIASEAWQSNSSANQIASLRPVAKPQPPIVIASEGPACVPVGPAVFIRPACILHGFPHGWQDERLHTSLLESNLLPLSVHN